MNVAILGTEQPSLIVADLINRFYNPWLEARMGQHLNIVAFVFVGGGEISPVIGNVTVLNVVQFASMYHKKIIDKIIFPREISGVQNQILSYFQSAGVKLEDVYVSKRLSNEMNIENFFEPYFSAKWLPYLEFHAAENCNLNCRACSHYCALVTKPKTPIYEDFERDFEQLRKFIDDIGVIRILGGEPLLNPEINKYVRLTRKLYPHAAIIIVTNAILLQKMPEDFFETLRQNNVSIHISLYPPMQNQISKIRQMLDSNKIPVTIGGVEKFFMRQTLINQNNKNEIFFKCNSTNCNFLYDGKVSVCPENATTKYFNEYYGKNLPADGSIDLYQENLTTEKLKRFLRTPFERCNYCTDYHFVKWSAVKQPSPITDWIIDDNAEIEEN